MKKIYQNRYHIIEPLQEGGMAKIYLADDLYNKQEVVVKVMNDEVKVSQAKKRFLAEIVAMSQLKHPNIAKYYAGGFEENERFIVMEYIRGGTLRDKIKTEGAIDSYEAVEIIKELCAAVVYIHNQKIIHRDIAPKNILFTTDGKLKITDFGISHISPNLNLTNEKLMIGSLHYMAPEICIKNMPSIQSDIYAIGIILFELLVGFRPFGHDESALEVNICYAHIHQTVPRITKINNKLNQRLENIVVKATAHNIKNRYQTVAEMLYDLKMVFSLSSVFDQPLFFINKISRKKNDKKFKFQFWKMNILNNQIPLHWLLISILVLLLIFTGILLWTK